MRVIRAQLDGPDAEPGRIQAADVARLILGLERAIARAAYLVLGQPRRGRGAGRHRHAIENAARLRFVGIERGSFVELLALPDTAAPTEEELPIAVPDLSSAAFDRLLDTVSMRKAETDPELAAAIARMATELGIGDRNTAITIADQSTGHNDRATRQVRIDATVRQRMQEISSPDARSNQGTLVGLLVAADFESNSARLRLADGSPVTVNFSADLADEIQDALRSRAGFEGAVKYHPRTTQAIGVELRSVLRGTQLALDAEEFWQPKTFAALQAAQQTSGRLEPTALAIDDLSEEERAAFLTEYFE